MNTYPIVRYCVSTALFAVSVSGCSKINNMEDKTNQLADTSKHLDQTSDKMAGNVERTLGISRAMYDTILLSSANTRGDAITQMKESESVVAKFGKAGEYYEALQFQLWLPQFDTEETREDMFLDAVKEADKNINEFIDDRSDFDPKKVAKNGNLYAMAGAMHETLGSQTRRLKGTEATPMSFLDVVEKGLVLNTAAQRGEVAVSDLPPYAREIGRNYHDFVYILRVRYNFLMAYAYAKARIDAYGDSPEGLRKIFGFLGATLFDSAWTPGFQKMQNAEIEYLATIMDRATQTRDFLKSIGANPMTNQGVRKALKNMRVGGSLTQERALSSDAKIRANALSILKVRAALDNI